MKHRILLCTALAVCALGLSACTSHSCGDDVKWKIDKNGTLTIYGKGEMKDNSYQNQSLSIKNVIIQDGVTSIGKNAFFWLDELTSVTIPESVTDIGDYAFYGCNSLTSVTIPESVTDIGDYAFYGCNSLTSVTIPKGVTSIGDHVFYWSDLTSVTIPDSVTSIGDFAFGRCEELRSVTIPDSVTSIGDYAFGNCDVLTSISIPDSVMSIGDGAFSQCSELTAITVSPDNPYFTAVNNVLFSKDQTHLICYPIGKQFTENEYVIPNSVLRIGDYAFRDSGLISVTIPDSVTSIGDYAFYSCSALTSVTIPDSVISIGDGAFSFCEELRTIAVNADNPYFTVKEDVLFSKNPMRLICYPVGKQDTEYIVPDGVTSIGECAFLKSPGLTSVTLPESVTDIDGGAFYLCDQLESVTVLNENCSIHDDTSLPEETTMPAISYCRIRGYAGSTAESYVNNTSGIEFETIPKAE